MCDLRVPPVSRPPPPKAFLPSCLQSRADSSLAGTPPILPRGPRPPGGRGPGDQGTGPTSVGLGKPLHSPQPLLGGHCCPAASKQTIEESSRLGQNLKAPGKMAFLSRNRTSGRKGFAAHKAGVFVAISKLCRLITYQCLQSRPCTPPAGA